MAKDRSFQIIFVIFTALFFNIMVSNICAVEKDSCSTYTCGTSKKISTFGIQKNSNEKAGCIFLGYKRCILNALSGSSIVYLIFAGFIILIMAPFILGIIELKKKKDLVSLSVDFEYTKDVNYFQKSFIKILCNALGDNPDNGVKKVKLSKEEIVEVSNSKSVEPGNVIPHILFVKGDLTTERNTEFLKEIYASGNVFIGEDSKLRSIAAKGNVFLAKNVKITRWAGCDGNIKAEEGVVFGSRTSCMGKMEIGKNCKIKYIYANPIITYLKDTVNEGKEIGHSIKDSVFFAGEIVTTIPADMNLEKDFISKNSVKICSGAKVEGNIKVYGDIQIESNVTILGNIFANGSIYINKNCIILGDIVSQKEIHVAAGVKVGNEDKTKTVISKKGVFLKNNIVIHGTILSEHIGKII